MREVILEWLANGQTGISSETIAFTALGIKYNKARHPYDPADFNRCLLLVEKCPEIINHFDKIKKLSPEWNAIISNWNEIKELFIQEVGWDWSKAYSAPKTYNRMKVVLESCNEKSKGDVERWRTHCSIYRVIIRSWFCCITFIFYLHLFCKQ